MKLRVAIGSILFCSYILIFTGIVDWFAGFNQTQSLIFEGKAIGLAKATTGIIFVYLMAIASVYFIVFTKEWHKNLLGCFLAILTFSVFLAF